MKPKISIIIPTYCSKDRHDWGRLYLSLYGFSLQTISKDDYEILVIDDGSEWDIQNLVKEWNIDCNINVYRQKHKGICSAYLTGLNYINSDLVLLGIDDNIPSAILLEEHLKEHEANENVVVWGREYHMRQMKKMNNPVSGLRRENEQPFINDTKISNDDIKYHFEKLVQNSIITDKYLDIEHVLETSTKLKEVVAAWLVMRLGNQSLSVHLLQKAGGIDSNFNSSGWYMDLELGLRLLKDNAYFKLSKKAEMIHLSHHREPTALQEESKNHRYFYSKHPHLSVALCPLFFKSVLGIYEYGQLISRAEHLQQTEVLYE